MGRSSHRRNLFLTAALRLNTTTGRPESRIHQAHITVTCPSPPRLQGKNKKKRRNLTGDEGTQGLPSTLPCRRQSCPLHGGHQLTEIQTKRAGGRWKYRYIEITPKASPRQRMDSPSPPPPRRTSFRTFLVDIEKGQVRFPVAVLAWGMELHFPAAVYLTITAGWRGGSGVLMG